MLNKETQPETRKKNSIIMKTNEKKNTEQSLSQDLTTVLAAADNRTDLWREMNAVARAWATAAPQSAQADSLRADAARLLGAITRLEQCWAYPGPHMLATVGESMTHDDAAT